MIAEALFTVKLRRREGFGRRLALLLPIYILLSIAIPNLIAHYVAGMISLTIFVLSLPLCVLLFENGFSDILYCCVCAQLTQNLAHDLENLLYPPGAERVMAVWFLVSVLSMAVVYAASFAVFNRRVENGSRINVSGRFVVPLAVVAMLFVYIMQYLLQSYGLDRYSVSYPPLAVCCVFGLCMLYGLLAYSAEKEEKARLEYFLNQANAQYEAAQANVNLLNMKAHDLKHYIRRTKELSGNVKELSELEQVVQEYETIIHCGNVRPAGQK